MAARFELKKVANRLVMFHFMAGHGEAILTSETSVAKAAAREGIAATRLNAPIDERYDRRIADDGQHYFVLRASNGRTLGMSESYPSTRAMEDGIAAVKRDAPDAPLEDLT